MKKKLAYCKQCQKDVNFIVKDEEIIIKSKRGEIVCTEKNSYCIQCDTEVFVDRIMDCNLSALSEAYREKHNVVSFEKILKIPKKYNIKTSQLSLLLGWDAFTLMKYCDGFTPTKQDSDMLETIYNDPGFYLGLLESNKKNLTSEFNYEMSKIATEKLLNIN